VYIYTLDRFISPTHKRTEGRAPVWGSEFTSKDAALQGGDPGETAARLNVKSWVLVTDWWWWSHPSPYSRPILYSRGHSRVLVCASVLRSLPPAAPPALPVAPALAPARGMIGRVSYTEAFFLCLISRRRQNNRSNRQRRREDTANDPNL
jgi:hypothetical protein